LKLEITGNQSMRILLALACLLIAPFPAYALVGGSNDVPGSPWAGVGAVTVNGGTYSGALIGSHYVLTAAHVVGGAAPGNVAFVVNSDSGSQIYSAESIMVFPGYSGTAPGADGVWHDDLALIRLATPVAGNVPVYDLYAGPLDGRTINLVGYGGSGDGINGVTGGASSSMRRVGQNRVDDLLVDDDGGTAAEIFLFDFDGPNAGSNVFGPDIPANLTLGDTVEAQFAGGDSGSPVFVNDHGEWKIAGIAAFNGSVTGLPGSNVLFGAIGGGTVVASYVPWIESAMAPVPEPDVWLSLLAGLAVMGAMLRRHGRAENPETDMLKI
jgi:secreted trypsin-like serine protease